MDNGKTGRFIAALRKEKGWTQAELADKLCVTDKAVSRWETGKGFPDVSLLKPISEALDVTVNELYIGERIKQENSRTVTDETLVRTLAKSERTINRIICAILYCLGAAVLIPSVLFLGYDTSWVAVYSTIGMILLDAAVFLTFKRRIWIASLSATLVLLLFFGLAEARDYVYVTQYSMPPLFNASIHTSFKDEKVIMYHKFFYDVYRYHCDKPDEYYVIK